ncbi:hypothetical protein [Bradyrhizobium sp.]|uniref:hypothetical protein n=1 Tax=Bradyrhizobium sp. TaxID=376 RepID=UPI00239B8B0D|nr:hypothetical protein [Bradyrhizobium sp.]MDE2380521.1 hypothetical protein [Bradyrhizobium sp.]
MRRAKIEEQNRFMVVRQREFRIAADVVTDAWIAFPEVQAVAVIGSVAKALRKEVPRFSEFRREGIEVWHECRDLDLALWIDSQDRLGALRRSAAKALREAYERGAGISVVSQQLDVFLIEPGSDRYLGRLCSFKECPKDKRECAVPGCGATPFNKVIFEFKPRADLLEPAPYATLYERGRGRLRSALDLPGTDESPLSDKRGTRGKAS